MKNVAVGIFMLSLLLVVTGCMDQAKEKDISESPKLMLHYLNDKYDVEFSQVQFIPAKRGVNDGVNENILIAESNEKIRVNVRETLGNPGKYVDNYLNMYVSDYVTKSLNFHTVPFVHRYYTYLNLYEDKTTLSDVKDEKITLNNETVINMTTVVGVNSPPNEEILKGLYELYLDTNKLGIARNRLLVSFNGDMNRTNQYIENYPVHNYIEWLDFDEEITSILIVTQNNLSFNEFKNLLTFRE